MLKNDLLLRAARGEQTERTPVWLMRQAGRILPEYRKVRESVSGFIELAKTPELVTEVTLQPVDILDVDAAIIFSDILVVPEAMGIKYVMEEGRGPSFPQPVTAPKDIDRVLTEGAAEELEYVYTSIRMTKSALNGRVPLIGFTGAPWTIFAYMTEGKGSKTFSAAKKWLYNHPEDAHRLLDKITIVTIDYLQKQVEAGAELIQIFDSWAGILSPDQYKTFATPYIQRICQAITKVPVTVFAKGAFFAMGDLATTGCSVLGLDWNQSPEQVRKEVGANITLQGNLDPCALYGSASDVKKATEKMLQSFGPQRHIANLGHGVYPDTDPEKVKVFIETVKNHRH